MIRPTEQEKELLRSSLRAVMAVPFIDDVEDFVWESVFAHVKRLQVPDPLFEIRSKRLFDVVDPVSRTGWSAKTIKCSSLAVNSQFELVIQRADIVKKAADLGFPGLTLDAPESTLGEALLTHWRRKVEEDSVYQSVDPERRRVCILLKGTEPNHYAFFEDQLAMYPSSDLQWRWTDGSMVGLQGYVASTGLLVYRWYPNQKQFFERFVLPDDAFFFELAPVRLDFGSTVDAITEMLRSSGSG